VVALGAVLTAPGATAAAPATISVTPTCGLSSVTLQVTADGVPRGQDLYLLATRPNGDTTFVDSYGDPAGHLADEMVLQLGRAPGAWISVHSYGSDARHAQTWYSVGCARFAAQPRLLVERPGRQAFAVDLSGFQGGMPIELTIPGVPPVSVAPNADGSFTGTVTFERQPPCGRSTITATQRTADPDPPAPDIELASPVTPAAAAPPAGETRTVALPVTVFCPRLTVTPTALADSALPGPADVAGTGWVPLRPVTLTIDGKPLGTVTPDRVNGDFAGPVWLPRLGCGAHRLEAVQVAQLSKPPVAPLTLRKAAAITVSCTPAFLAVDPAVSMAGMVTTAAGAGFVAGRTVRLEWIDLDARPLGDAGTATVGAGGTFMVPCLVLPNSALGTRRLRAVEVVAPADPVAARTGMADLLVVPSSMERGRDQFLERG
jgi:hypothetical protein